MIIRASVSKYEMETSSTFRVPYSDITYLHSKTDVLSKFEIVVSFLLRYHNIVADIANNFLGITLNK